MQRTLTHLELNIVLVINDLTVFLHESFGEYIKGVQRLSQVWRWRLVLTCNAKKQAELTDDLQWSFICCQPSVMFQDNIASVTLEKTCCAETLVMAGTK